MNKIVLIHPNPGKYLQFYTGRPSLPGSILLVGIALHEAHFQVSLIDQNTEPNWKEKITSEIDSNIICLASHV